MLRKTFTVAALAVAGFAMSGIMPGTADANPPYKMIVICQKGETIEVPLWRFVQGEYPGAVEGPCPQEPVEETPPPVEEQPPPSEPPVKCAEGDPCWDCETMGNKRCGAISTPSYTPVKHVPRGELPYTGFEWWMVAFGGVVLIVIGATLVWIGRPAKELDGFGEELWDDDEDDDWGALPELVIECHIAGAFSTDEDRDDMDIADVVFGISEAEVYAAADKRKVPR